MKRFISILALLILPYVSRSAIWYAAPVNATPPGMPGNTGTIASPWDLQTAFNKTVTVLPGDILWLRGGVYTNAPQGVVAGNEGYIYRITISGNFSSQITIRSYPGERARIDGGAFGTGIYAFHANARPTVQVGSSGSSTLGNYVTLQDVEIFSSSTEPRFSSDGANPTFPNDIHRSDGIVVHARGFKLINCIVHNTTAGISNFGTSAYGNEFYGNMIFNFGWQGTPSPHGHGFYVQGPVSAGGLFQTVKRNVLGGGYRHNTQIYGSSSAQISHFRVSENTFIGQQGSKGALLLGTLNGGASDRLQDNEVTGNFGYGSDLSLFYQRDPNAYHSAKVFGNYFVQSKLAVSSWKSLIFTNNYIIDPVNISFGNVTLQTNGTFLPWTFNRNTYVFSAAGYTGFNLDGGSFYTLAGWQALTGYDLNSTVSGSVPSGTNYMIVQSNVHDTNRATVICYNWTGATHVAANLSTLGWGVGATVTVRNAQDYFLDTESALTTSTNTLVLDMQAASHTVAIPYGASAAIIPKTFPAFGAFILELVTSQPAPIPAPNFTAQVTSTQTAVPITVSPVDVNGAGNGTTPFVRTNAQNVITTLTAPSVSGSTFVNWTRAPGGPFYSGSTTMTFTNIDDSKWEAVYTASTTTLTVLSSTPASGVSIQMAPADINGASNGDTSFQRTVLVGNDITLTAPLASADGNVFVQWLFNGNPWATTLATTVTAPSFGGLSMTAVYAAPSPPPTGTSFSGRRRGIRL